MGESPCNVIYLKDHSSKLRSVHRYPGLRSCVWWGRLFWGEGGHFSTRYSSGLYSVPALILTFYSSLILGLQNAQVRDVF